MGVNVVEREGISFTHPARFILVGTMNPEEGDLRPQLLDRFALCVDIQGIHDPRPGCHLANATSNSRPIPMSSHRVGARDRALSEEIVQARELGLPGRILRRDLSTIAQLDDRMKVDGHRADMVILKTARAHASFEGARRRLRSKDILLAAELALPHRLKRQPFEEAVMDSGQLEDRLKKARVEAPAETPPPSPDESQQTTSSVKKAPGR